MGSKARESHESCVCIAGFSACGCQKKSVVYETECRHSTIMIVATPTGSKKTMRKKGLPAVGPGVSVVRASEAMPQLVGDGAHGKITADALSTAQEGDGGRVEAVVSRLLRYVYPSLTDAARSGAGGGRSDPGHASNPPLELHVGEDHRQAVPAVIRPGEVLQVLQVVVTLKGVGEVRGRVVLKDGDVSDAETHVVPHAVLVKVRAAEQGVSTAHCVLHDVRGGHDVTASHVTEEEMICHQVQGAA